MGTSNRGERSQGSRPPIRWPAIEQLEQPGEFENRRMFSTFEAMISSVYALLLGSLRLSLFVLLSPIPSPEWRS